METRLIQRVIRKRRRTLKVSILRTLAEVVESAPPAWCNECGAEVPIIRAEQAALMELTTLLEIYQKVGTGK
jgi:hypothetical protein